jgi:hypothetical protein
MRRNTAVQTEVLVFNDLGIAIVFVWL